MRKRIRPRRRIVSLDEFMTRQPPDPRNKLEVPEDWVWNEETQEWEEPESL